MSFFEFVDRNEIPILFYPILMMTEVSRYLVPKTYHTKGVPHFCVAPTADGRWSGRWSSRRNSTSEMVCHWLWLPRFRHGSGGGSEKSTVTVLLVTASDWLQRFYGFYASDLTAIHRTRRLTSGSMDFMQATDIWIYGLLGASTPHGNGGFLAEPKIEVVHLTISIPKATRYKIY